MIELRYYQDDAHKATVEHCKNSKDYAIHDQSVGAGKTLQIAFAVKHVCDKGGSCLVLARQGELVEQDADDYKMIGGKCSIFSASLGMKSSYYPAVFGSEGTVYRSLNTEFKSRKFHFIAIDECHEVNHQEIYECLNDYQNGFNIYENKDQNGKPKYSQYAVILAHFININPAVRIIGYSGSPFRGSESIIGGFWKKKLSEVGTYQLVNDGYLVPPVFGWGSDDDHNYHLESFSPSKNENGSDFGSKELAAMQREILKDKTTTQLIVEEVIERTRDRLGVLITCAGKKHCEEVAKHLPVGSYGIVTDSTGATERRRILKDAKSGKIKYTLQVSCLGQGINIPYWDTCVILRKIGSLRYLIQLIGRVLRLLKDDQIESGLQKYDGLVLDFTDTMEVAGDIYDHPITDIASAEKAKANNKTQECPKCKTENSEHAVRCRGIDSTSTDGRCEHYFKFVMCLHCHTENAPTARTCRKCDAILIDPNTALSRKSYSDADYKPVISMTLEKNKSGGLRLTYTLDSTYHKNGEELPEVATEFYDPASDKQFQKARWFKFVSDHIQGNAFRRTFAKMHIDSMIKNQAMLDTPTHITHRINDKGFSVVNRKKFRSGREEKAS